MAQSASGMEKLRECRAKGEVNVLLLKSPKIIFVYVIPSFHTFYIFLVSKRDLRPELLE
jgi:hypothetical protein